MVRHDACSLVQTGTRGATTCTLRDTLKILWVKMKIPMTLEPA